MDDLAKTTESGYRANRNKLSAKRGIMYRRLYLAPALGAILLASPALPADASQGKTIYDSARHVTPLGELSDFAVADADPYWDAYNRGYAAGKAAGAKSCSKREYIPNPHHRYDRRYDKSEPSRSAQGWADGYKAGHEAACGSVKQGSFDQGYMDGTRDGSNDAVEGCQRKPNPMFLGANYQSGYYRGYNEAFYRTC